jgi:hypothetical protein
MSMSVTRKTWHIGRLMPLSGLPHVTELQAACGIRVQGALPSIVAQVADAVQIYMHERINNGSVPFATDSDGQPNVLWVNHLFSMKSSIKAWYSGSRISTMRCYV